MADAEAAEKGGLFQRSYFSNTIIFSWSYNMHMIYTTPEIYGQKLSAVTSSYKDLIVRWNVEAKHGN